MDLRTAGMLGALAQRERRFRGALQEALMRSVMQDEVDAKITFDDFDEALAAGTLLVNVLATLGLYDRDKSMAAVPPASPRLELTNGSCISFHFADKVKIDGRWTKLLDAGAAK